MKYLAPVHWISLLASLLNLWQNVWPERRSITCSCLGGGKATLWPALCMDLAVLAPLAASFGWKGVWWKAASVRCYVTFEVHAPSKRSDRLTRRLLALKGRCQSQQLIGTELGRFDFHKHCTLDALHGNSESSGETVYRLLLWRGVMVYKAYSYHVPRYSCIALYSSACFTSWATGVACLGSSAQVKRKVLHIEVRWSLPKAKSCSYLQMCYGVE